MREMNASNGTETPRLNLREYKSRNKKVIAVAKNHGYTQAVVSVNDILPFLVSTDAQAQPEELRRRMRRDGYLFFRGLPPKEKLLELRRIILEICQKNGWLIAGSELMEGLTHRAPCVEGQEDFMRVYDEVQTREEFHALGHDDALVGTISKLAEEQVFVFPLKVMRITFPNNVRETTPSHQDYVHLQGTLETYTTWIPLGDTPRELGGLSVLAGSNKLGVLQPRAAYGAGGLGLDTDQYNLPWHGGDFQCGDAIIFSSLTVHRALPNLTADKLRISVDYRYAGLSHAVTHVALKPHFASKRPHLNWDNLDRHWKNQSLRRYWEKLPVRVVERTDAWHKTAAVDEKKERA